ncbi:MAG: hypothetical protein COB08_010115 [Rhodobacteraceae bacterium]|nr:hypothetical protein [Paracoccaceae bacterium]
MAVEIYEDGPLKGMASVTVLIEANNVAYLKHATIQTGYSIEELAEISVNEAALDHARRHQLFKRGDSDGG